METTQKTAVEVNQKLAGNVANFFTNWTFITSDQTILRWVKGYHIPFEKTPYQDKIPNVVINKMENNLYDLAIKQLLKKGAISQCTHISGEFISSYFLVPKTDGGHRFVLNLKKLNYFIKAPHFKLEDYR